MKQVFAGWVVRVMSGGIALGMAMPVSGQKVDFVSEVFPILQEQCIECHGPDKAKGNFRLDTRAGAFREDYQIVPEKPVKSELYIRVMLPPTDEDRMPPKGDPLTRAQTHILRRWIQQGADWVDVALPSAAGKTAAGSVDFDRDVQPILNGLTPEQRAVLLAWAAQGAPGAATPSPSRPTPPANVGVPAAPPKTARVLDGLVALYDFTGEGDTVRDQSGAGEPLNLRIEKPDAVRRSAGELEVRGSVKIQSAGPARKIIESVRTSQEITVEAWLRPANTTQDGPARIVSVSGDTSQRNITLGQDGNKYDLRLRSTGTSSNGIPSTATAGNSLQTEVTHVVYTRERSGHTRIFLNGKQAAEGKASGDLKGWDRGFRLALGNELTGDRPWLGSLYLVAIYSRALNAGEVVQNHKAGAGAKADPETFARMKSAKLFEAHVAPIIARHCLECHDTAVREGKLDLSQRAAAFAGGGEGPPIIPGDPDGSLLFHTVAKNEMPDDRPPLSDDEKTALREWIETGAVWTLPVIDLADYTHDGRAQEQWVQRLTVTEYIDTVRSAVGVDISAEARRILPADLRADGFSNTAYNLTVDLSHVQAYAQLAELIVKRMDTRAFAAQFSRSRDLGGAGMRELIQGMGKWLLRGPLNDEEIEAYLDIVTTVSLAGGDYDEAVSYLTEAMLQSPRFIYRIEDQRRGTLSAFELASRLSYIIWGGPPDTELMRAAESGQLARSAEINRQVRRMLQDPRTVRRSLQFIDEWLNLGRLQNLRPNPKMFPQWDAQLAADMRTETLAFFEEVVWRQNRPLADLLNSQVTFASPRLARHYGLQPPQGARLARYDLSGVPARGGLLTQGSVLTMGGDEASMVSRGLFILHNVLRGAVKDPPTGTNTTPVPAEPGLSRRAVALTRINDPNCGNCHGKFEPLAFGLEKFDGIGAFKEKDEHGNQLREDGKILFPGTAEPVSYDKSAELMDLLAASSRVQENLTWKVTQFALGRPLVAADAPFIKDIHRRAQTGGGTYASVVAAIVTSELVIPGVAGDSGSVAAISQENP